MLSRGVGIFFGERRGECEKIVKIIKMLLTNSQNGVII